MVVLVGLGDGVGDCHDAANLSKRRSFYFPLTCFFGQENYALFSRVCFFYSCKLLSMQVTKREPTPGYYDAYSVGTPYKSCWEKGGQNHCKATVLPLFKRVFLVNKRRLALFLRVWFLIFVNCWVCWLLSGSPPHATVMHFR